MKRCWILKAFVLGGIQLDTLAKSAFQSYCRAYAAYPRELKKIFHPKKLHLGHVARSFALKSQPSQIGVNTQPPHFVLRPFICSC